MVAVLTALAVAGAPAAVPQSTPDLRPVAATTTSVYRMNAGGPAVTDSIGRLWRADEYAVGGASHTVTNTIAGTADQALFQSERWGMTGYDIPAANGTYTLQLLLAELNPASGTRIFSVTANGSPVLTNYNIAANVGNYRAVVKAATVTVTSGVLSLRFTASANSASVTGIELLSDTTPSAEAMPVGDLAGWRQIFADNFATPAAVGSFPGTAYNGTWRVYPDGWSDTSHHGTYYPSKVLSVADGVLKMHLHTENGVHMVANPIPKLPGLSNGQTYGRYSVRFKADSIAGYKTAWLLWPDSEVWPGDGEIDFPEGNLNGTISAFMHFADPAGGQNGYSTSATYTSWHTATTEWSPGKVTFLLDDVVVGTSTTKVPSKPMHYMLQTETCLGSCTTPDSSTGDVLVDWVVVYAKA
ncbi:malectin domain-containing carbohydrate-binding protein [Catellatospora sp. KI3]|uniref:malectin domain-containing carbohydrate-binding protein n=1 Tax=Catellatospora sp. KI3 TaxID=3041620 RepID=UPI0024826F4D|nr:malectin domain-containing carbohydrate-binding protein [Catellatospora sp. KI3]MDI1464714.1 malectin domain-containing carbohydrate-binding protein [Catellatospora sp. KI3]